MSDKPNPGIDKTRIIGKCANTLVRWWPNPIRRWPVQENGEQVQPSETSGAAPE
jgi:hypothetical protein